MRRLARELDIGQYFFAPSWIVHKRAGLSTEPEGFLVTWDRFVDGRFRFDPKRKHRALGAPTMAFEAVSPSSKKKDLVELARLAGGRSARVSFRVGRRGARLRRGGRSGSRRVRRTSQLQCARHPINPSSTLTSPTWPESTLAYKRCLQSRYGHVPGGGLGWEAARRFLPDWLPVGLRW